MQGASRAELLSQTGRKIHSRRCSRAAAKPPECKKQMGTPLKTAVTDLRAHLSPAGLNIPWGSPTIKNSTSNIQHPRHEECRKPFGLRPSLFLAAIYSRGTYRPTTIDVLMFHFRVRNGTGWDHQAMTTRLRGSVLCLLIPFTVYPVGHVAACCVVAV